MDPLQADVDLLVQILRDVVERHEGTQVATLLDRVHSVSGTWSPEEIDELAVLFAELDLPSTTMLSVR